MPVIKKDNPNANSRPVPPARTTMAPTFQAQAGSVLSEAIPVDQLPEDFMRLVLYGGNRIGKTTVAVTFPKPLLLVAMEPNVTGGAMSVKKVSGVTYLRVGSTEKAIRLAEELRTGGTGFKAVVIDSATSYQDIALTELMGWQESPTMLTFGLVGEDMYRQRSEKCREMLRKFLNLPMHTVVIAKEKDHNPPKGERSNKLTRGLTMSSFFAADLGGATANWLHDVCDCICRMYMAEETVKTTSVIAGKEQEAEIPTGRMIRRLLTQYHPNFAAGIRSCTPENVPEYIDDPRACGLATTWWDCLKAVVEGRRIKNARYSP